MINYLKIEGYKSFKNMELELAPVNILIGGNGSGKSNFISFFKLLNAIFNNHLQRYVLEEGTDNILYFGRKHTESLKAMMVFSKGEDYNNAYRFALAQTNNESLYIDYEGSGYNVSLDNNEYNYFYNHTIPESKFSSVTDKRHKILQDYITNLKVFHFHDTSSTSYLRKASDLNDNITLRPDGRNLAAFLFELKQNHSIIYNRILKTVQAVAPYLHKFILEPVVVDKEKDIKRIELRWVDSGDLESNFSAYQLSDGTLRFIALTTLLMQPNPPDVIIIDEPELGLHPFAINKLAGLIRSASVKAQIIVATQSPGLISNFSAEDIIVIDRSEEEKQTKMKRLNSEELSGWLADFSLGDLWERNIISAAQPFIR